MSKGDKIRQNNLEQVVADDLNARQVSREAHVQDLLRVLMQTTGGANQKFVVEGYTVTVTTGMGIEVSTGTAVAPFTPPATFVQAEWSPYAYVRNDAASQPLTVAASDLTNPRVDAVVITPTFTEEGSESRNIYNPVTKQYVPTLVPKRSGVRGVASIIQGTPAASPVAPAVPSDKVKLAEVTVPAGATSLLASNVKDKRSMLGVVHKDEDGIFRTKDPIEIDASGSLPNFSGPQVFTAIETVQGNRFRIPCVGFNMVVTSVTYAQTTGIWTGTVKASDVAFGPGGWVIAIGVPKQSFSSGTTNMIQLIKWAQGDVLAAGTIVAEFNAAFTPSEPLTLPGFLGSAFMALSIGSTNPRMLNVEEFSDPTNSNRKYHAITWRLRPRTLTVLAGNQFQATVEYAGDPGDGSKTGIALVLRTNLNGFRAAAYVVTFASPTQGGSAQGSIVAKWGQLSPGTTSPFFSPHSANNAKLGMFGYATVLASGAVLKGVNVQSVAKTSTGRYLVTFGDWPAGATEPVVIASPVGTLGTPRLADAVTNNLATTGGPNIVEVRTYTLAGAFVDSDFHVIALSPHDGVLDTSA